MNIPVSNMSLSLILLHSVLSLRTKHFRIFDCSAGRTFTLCTWKTEGSGKEVRKEFNSQIKLGT